MRATTSSSRSIGVAGLVWFLFFAGAATFCVLRPDALRKYSAPTHTWTEREIWIGAACNVVIGSAGLVLAFRRLLLPLFLPPLHVRADASSLQASVAVAPSFGEFETVHRAVQRRRFLVSSMVWILSMAGGFAITQTVLLPNRVDPRVALVMNFAGFVMAVLVGIAIRFFRQVPASDDWVANAHLHLASRYDFFEDGLRVFNGTFAWEIPWPQVQQAVVVDNVLGLIVDRDLLIIPASALARAGALEAVVDLLRRKVKNRLGI
jgi:hypothetical protein